MICSLKERSNFWMCFFIINWKKKWIQFLLIMRIQRALLSVYKKKKNEVNALVFYFFFFLKKVGMSYIKWWWKTKTSKRSGPYLSILFLANICFMYKTNEESKKYGYLLHLFFLELYWYTLLEVTIKISYSFIFKNKY